MIRKYKAVSWILAAAAAVSLTACGGGASSGSASEAKAVSAETSEAADPGTEEKTAAESGEKSEAVSESAGTSDDASESAATKETSESAKKEEASESADTEKADASADSKDTKEASDEEETDDVASAAEAAETKAELDAKAPQIPGLTYDHAMELEDADFFEVYYYDDGYKLIDIPQAGQYLVIPEGKEAPEGIDPEIYLLEQPLDQVYMAATGSMSFIDQLGAMDHITMSSLDKDGWMIEAPVRAMEDGNLVYAGKYSEPDYEMMIGKGCDLAIESTMILHSPEVQEMIEDLGIPVLIDRSSYELDAFGRIEWIKMYGALFDLEDVAEEKFAEQKAVLDSIEDYENTGKTVAFFAVNTNNTITVRKSEDFIPNMIELAGGKYIFEDLENPNSSSASVRISMEEFYNTAVDADYLIYNGTIEAPLTSIDDLIGKDELFSEFKAVKEGNVWTVDKTWYQSTATIAYLITDLANMLRDGDPDKMVFLKKVE